VVEHGSFIVEHEKISYFFFTKLSVLVDLVLLMSPCRCGLIVKVC
jgi:hypothetical protein